MLQQHNQLVKQGFPLQIGQIGQTSCTFSKYKDHNFWIYKALGVKYNNPNF